MTKTVKEVRELVKKYVTTCYPCVARQPIDLKKKYVLKVRWQDGIDPSAPHGEEEVVWNARLEEGRNYVADTMKRDARDLLSKKYPYLKEMRDARYIPYCKYSIDIVNEWEVLYDIEDTFGVYKDKLTCWTENWRGNIDPNPDELFDGILDARHEAAKEVLKKVLNDKGVKKAIKKALENAAKK